MDIPTTISLGLIGLAAVAAGGVGVMLPVNERLTAALPLVVGAGVGVITLSIGSLFVEPSEPQEELFLVGSALGFASTVGLLAVLWRRRGHGAVPEPSGGDSPTDTANGRDMVH